MSEQDERAAQPVVVPEKKSSDSVPAAPEAKPSDAPSTPGASPAQASEPGTPATGPLNTTPETKPPVFSPAPPAPSVSPAAAEAPQPAERKPLIQTDSGRDTLFVSTPSASGTKTAGHTCPKCGHLNRAGILVCEKCGTLLIGDEQVGGTKRFESEQQKAAAPAALPATPPAAAEPPVTLIETSEMISAAVSTAGSAQFTDNMVLRLEIEGAPTPILLHPKYETSLGRRDPATGTMPDVDLSAYAGYRLGVSRKHAIIRLKNERLEIYDLGSSNGTAVNGTRLTAHQPQVLRDGDEVLLGKMMLRVLFQVRSRR